tara:strand:- start:3032 stop:3310 length:279 start_codon:yes stop_codon:yes gene_type:complete
MCNCFEETMEKVTEHIKEQLPDNVEEFKAEWQGRAYMLAEGQYAPTSPKIDYEYRPMKRDGTPQKNLKKDSITILASHCCYCGEKFERPEKS